MWEIVDVLLWIALGYSLGRWHEHRSYKKYYKLVQDKCDEISKHVKIIEESIAKPPKK